MLEFDASQVSIWFARKFGFGDSVRRRVWLKLAKLLENGVPIKTALESMRARRARLKGKSDTLVLAYDDWLTQINNGRRFSDAIRGWVGYDELLLLSAGEQSGHLEKALHSAVMLIEASKRIKAAVLGGITYPIILILISFGILYLFGIKVYPVFSRVVPEDKWVGLAADMVVFSRFVQDWLWLAGLVVVSLIVLILGSMPYWTGQLRVRFDAYPPWSVYRVVKGSAWLIALSALVSAGVRVEDALRMMNARATPWMRERIDALLVGLSNGLTVSDALARSGHNFPDPDIVDDLGVYAQLTSFDQALETIGRETLTFSVESIQRAMKVIFNVGVVLVAGLIAWMISGLVSMQMQLARVLTL